MALTHASGPAAAPRTPRLMNRAERRGRLIAAGICGLLPPVLIGTGHTEPYLILPLEAGAFLVASGFFGQRR
jgi:hypothetical protein